MTLELDRRRRLEQAEALIEGRQPAAGAQLLEQLREAAERAQANAYAPYSNFAVGAALLGEDGEVYAGCNVENASYGATLCAERSAVAQMVAAGGRRALVCVVLGSGPTAVPPCGPCRQVLSEFGTRFVVSFGPAGSDRRWTMDALLPDPMGEGDLG